MRNTEIRGDECNTESRDDERRELTARLPLRDTTSNASVAPF